MQLGIELSFLEKIAIVFDFQVSGVRFQGEEVRKLNTGTWNHV